jgi:hypothetical protein
MAKAPNTRKWSAVELSDPTGRTAEITVGGEVEVTATNYVPKLSLHKPQGINPRVLMLDLTIENDRGFGGQVMMYKPVVNTQPTGGRDYDEVSILFDGAIIERIKVDHPMS